MKRKEFLKEIAGLGLQEVRTRIRANSEEQMKLRFRQASGQLQQPGQVKQLRRQRARLLTIANTKTVSK